MLFSVPKEPFPELKLIEIRVENRSMDTAPDLPMTIQAEDGMTV